MMAVCGTRRVDGWIDTLQQRRRSMKVSRHGHHWMRHLDVGVKRLYGTRYMAGRVNEFVASNHSSPSLT